MPVDAAVEEQFGPYLVYERLGVGGMATVHRALEQAGETGFERTVALKRLLPHLAEDASFIKSFVREAKLASILNHVNIVQIYELGRVGTEYFISMEYIDGRDIRRLLRHARKVTGPPPIHISVGLMLQLCDALDYAHNKADEDGQPLGLVHRDISPSNLIVTSGGHLKIIDFGIAKAQSSQLRTQTGRVKGKLAYMAPEAISGSRDLDARSDIWATGVIIHELLTARPLFASKNEYQTLLKVQRGDIMPPSTFNQACPPELDAIVFRALARDPGERFANAAELREALVKLKRQYSLLTGHRDISSWLEWAFGLELPAGFTGNTNDSSGVMSVDTPRPRQKTPLPAHDQDEEEAVEVVWGSGNNESQDGHAVVLEDVPDVSEKHHRARRDTDDESPQDDDIPTPLPSHGTMPSIYGTDENLVVHVPNTQPGLPPRGIDPALARGTDPPVARGSDQMRAQGRVNTGMQQVRAHRTTSPGVAAAKTSDRVPVQKPSDRMPAQKSGQRGSEPANAGERGPMSAVDAPQINDRMAAQRARDSDGPPNRVRAESVTTSGADSIRTNPLATPITEAELFGNDAHDALRTVSASIEAQRAPGSLDAEALFDESADAAETIAIKGGRSQLNDEPTTSPEIRPVADLPKVPIVRFSKNNTIPPATVPVTTGLESNRGSIPTTKPGIAPVPAHAARPLSLSKPPTNVSAPISAPIGASIAARKPSRAWLYIVIGVMIAGGTATAVTMMLAQGGNSDDAVSPAPNEAPAPRAVATHAKGTVKVVTEPADAEIKIEGQPVHVGSPWQSELAAGIHKVEIHRAGYKSWLTSIELSENENQTLRVALEPLSNLAAGDATLTIATDPAGLDVQIDGEWLTQRTPIKINLKVGPHKIAVRQNGVEVWQQNLNAEASSDYEFNPSFSAAKQRERAQRIPAAKAAPAPAPAPPAPAPAPATAPPSVEPAKPEVKASTDKQQPPPKWVAPGGTSMPAPVAVVVAPQPPVTTSPPPPSATPPPAELPPPPPVATKPAARPPVVAPTAVRKLSGEPPSIEKFKTVELPTSLSAKVCIDESGKVTMVELVQKLDRRVAADLADALRSWKYAPYAPNGVASPACFVVMFRVK